ncbi:MAG: hypothetical protein ACD_28C00186G0001 [uncultured bacterium]|nr:MAG: hypothetical protein ACD_28C00186G0001 [uncultured bacterium]
MTSIIRTCRISGTSFLITDEDQAFYLKMGVPLPTLCPEERQRRRLSFRNERHLYHRKCDLCDKQIISIYHANSHYTVYCNACWWSDKWDASSYGLDFDFNRPFFDQFRDLQLKVPRLAMLSIKVENSDYTNCVSNLKDCYLIFSADFNQECFYGVWIENSKNCVDNLLIDGCELAYECFYSQKLYRCIFVFNSSQCTDSAFLYDCKNSQDCFMSSGLRNKQYYIRNKAYSKEEYFKIMRSLNLGSHEVLSRMKEEFSTLLKESKRLFMNRIGQIENSSGDFLMDTQNVHDSFELMRSKDCRYIQGGFNLKDVYDGSYVAMGELAYENCESVPVPYRSAFNVNSYTGQNLFYTDTCMTQSKDLFGCIGLRQKQYCILNKAYSAEAYRDLVLRIVEFMRKTGEWGEFFPIALSPFAYNETSAYDYYPVDQKEAFSRGYSWKEEDENSSYQGPVAQIPDRIEDVSDEITKQILRCEVSGKLYKIIPQELAFYRQMGLAIPRRSPDQRHKDRMALRNPRHLWERTCALCADPIQTSYAPDRPEKVYCEACYLKEIY